MWGINEFKRYGGEFAVVDSGLDRYPGEVMRFPPGRIIEFTRHTGRTVVVLNTETGEILAALPVDDVVVESLGVGRWRLVHNGELIPKPFRPPVKCAV